MSKDDPNSTSRSKPSNRRRSRLSEFLHQDVSLPLTLPVLLAVTLSTVVELLIGWHLLLLGERVGSHAVLLFVALLLPLLLLQFFMHEIGHLLLAYLVRLRIDQFKIGPFLLSFGRREARFGIVWSLHQPVAYVAAVPTSDRFPRLRMFLFVLAGAIASFCVGILCWMIASSINEPAQFSSVGSFTVLSTNPAWLFPGNLAVACFGISGVLAFGIGTLSLIPTRLSGVTSDGAKLIDLLLKRDQTERNVVHSMLAIQMVQGTRPRDWNQALVDRLLKARTDSSDNAPANLFAYYWAVDCGKIEEARHYLQLALSQFEGYPIDTRAALFLEGAYFAARYDDDVPASFGWLADSREGYAEEQTRCRAEAALLLARGQFAEARDCAEAGLRAIPNSKDLCGRIAEQEWLEDLLRQCPAT